MYHKIFVLSILVFLAFGISNAMGANEITFDVNKSTYKPGDIVTINGTSKDSPNQPVAVEVKDPSGNILVIRTVETDSNGNFQLKFKLPETAAVGNYNVVTNAQVNGSTVTETKQIIQNTTPSVAPSQPVPSTQSTTQPKTQTTSAPFGGRCLIATAAFGSDISPQVQFLREFRDQRIQSTEAGASFMTVFNTWYYSFSPYVADYERQQPWLQDTVRTAVYPLLGILTASEKAYSVMPGDYGSLSAGLIASSMIGAVYFWPFALPLRQIRTKDTKYNYKLALGIFVAVLTCTISSILIGNHQALMITTALFVLTLIGIFATLSAKWIVNVSTRLKKITRQNYV